MKKYLSLAMTGLFLTLAIPSFTQADCGCDKECASECAKGKTDKCKCSDCSCSHGSGCKHGKCKMKAAGTKPSESTQQGTHNEKEPTKP